MIITISSLHLYAYVNFILYISSILSFSFSVDSYSSRLQNCRQIGLWGTFLHDYVNPNPYLSIYGSADPSVFNFKNAHLVSREGDNALFNISMNDIFRFSSGRNDRFLSIFERVDNTLSQSFVHFVGFEASLYKIGNYTSVFYCTFFHNSHLHTLPVPSSHESTLTVVHERMLHGYDNEITCKIPKLDCCHGEPLSLSLGMVQKHSLLNISSFPEESGPKNSFVVYPTLSQSLTLLLPLVRLPRAEVSRILRFNVSMSTMVKNKHVYGVK